MQNTINIFPESQFTLLDIDKRRLQLAKNKIQPLTSRPIRLENIDIRHAIFPKNSFDIIQSAFSFNFLKGKCEFINVVVADYNSSSETGR